MTLCCYCENESNTTCCKCKQPVCAKHSHYKDHVFDNYYEANLAGHKYTYEVYCEACDIKFISFDFLKLFIALIIAVGFLISILGLRIGL